MIYNLYIAYFYLRNIYGIYVTLRFIRYLLGSTYDIYKYIYSFFINENEIKMLEDKKY